VAVGSEYLFTAQLEFGLKNGMLGNISVDTLFDLDPDREHRKRSLYLCQPKLRNQLREADIIRVEFVDAPYGQTCTRAQSPGTQWAEDGELSGMDVIIDTGREANVGVDDQWHSEDTVEDRLDGLVRCVVRLRSRLIMGVEEFRGKETSSSRRIRRRRLWGRKSEDNEETIKMLTWAVPDVTAAPPIIGIKAAESKRSNAQWYEPCDLSGGGNVVASFTVPLRMAMGVR
jgi:hypothetical protein